MEMHQVRYFVTLCETLNFTKAAESCNISQPSLTKAIHKLEDELGGPLFCRERGRTHLTNLGKAMQPHLLAVFNSSEAARGEAHSYHHMDKASLTVGIMSSIGPERFVRFLKRFNAEAPKASLRLQNNPAATLVELLLEGKIDAAILDLPELPERCTPIDLFEETYKVAFPEDHHFQNMDHIDCTELRDENILHYSPNKFSYRDKPTDTAELHLSDHIRFESDNIAWIQALIHAGQGVSVLPEHTLLQPHILSRPFHRSEHHRCIRLVTVSGRRHAPVLRTFISLAAQHDWQK